MYGQSHFIGQGRRVSRAIGVALDILLPPQCLGCARIVPEPGTLCAGCWEHIDFLGQPLCHACGAPFEFDHGADTLCGVCARERPVFGRARAVMRYDDQSRDLILGFKHADRTFAAPAFARWMVRAGVGLINDADLVVPVPLHRLRLWRRRYNQAALLALGIAKLAGRQTVPDLLLRTRATPSQGRLSAAQRRVNVRGAFAVRPQRRDLLAGKRVLLVDDVMTTGATVSASARVLLRAGAAAVDVVTLARVVRPVSAGY